MTSEPAEHIFGSTLVMKCDFTVFEYASLAEKEGYKNNIIHKSDIKPSHEAAKGYAATCEWQELYIVDRDFLAHNLIDDSAFGGDPCKIYLDENVPPVCEQLWSYVAVVIHLTNSIMEPLLKLVGASKKDISPFLWHFVSAKVLQKEHCKYCPYTFKYGSTNGEGIILPPTAIEIPMQNENKND